MSRASTFSRAFYLSRPVILLCGVLAVSLTGCTDNKSGDWYDQSRGVKDDKAGYIEAQTRMGMSETDAARQYELERAIRQTEGRDPMVSPRPGP